MRCSRCRRPTSLLKEDDATLSAKMTLPDDWQYTLCFLSWSESVCPRSGALTANIQHICSLPDQLLCVLHSCIHAHELAAVTEAVRSYIQNAHDLSPSLHKACIDHRPRTASKHFQWSQDKAGEQLRTRLWPLAALWAVCLTQTNPYSSLLMSPLCRLAPAIVRLSLLKHAMLLSGVGMLAHLP